MVANQRKFLVMDLGGTKLHAACAVESGNAFVIQDEVKLLNQHYPDFMAAVSDLPTNLKKHPFDAVGVCIGGPTREDEGALTNLDWRVSRALLQEKFAVAKVVLMNDMQAQGYGTLGIAPENTTILQRGTSYPRANRAVIALGTGLGEGMLTRDGEQFYAHAGEGGHATFASETERDWQLYSFLRKKYKHVSWERIVSGKDGMRNLLEFLCQGRGNDEYTQALAGHGDVGRFVMEKARGGDSICKNVVDLFIEYSAREAGNLCLKAYALGGLYLCGGIAPRLLPELQASFCKYFSQKGRFQDLLTEVPITVCQDPNQALRGVATAVARN